DESGIGQHVRPHIVVPAGVAELINDEVVGRTLLFPDEVVRVECRTMRRLASRASRARGAIDKTVDRIAVIGVIEDLEYIDTVRGDPGRVRGEGREPRHAHECSL